MKRKINVLSDQSRFAEIIPLAQRVLDRLDHYEQHVKDYVEDSYRLSWSDTPSDRDRYIDFSRAQANGFIAIAYARLSEMEEADSKRADYAQSAREYLDHFDQSDYGKSFGARRMIVPAQMALGLYDEAMVTCDEIERRMGSDTVNTDYATLLRDRAIVAHAKGNADEAFSLMSRHARLAQAVSDSLHRSEAHDYAARYHAKEQELTIQEQKAEAKRKNVIIWTTVLITLLAIAFAVYSFIKNRIINQKNRVLVRMINEKESMKEANSDPALFATVDATIRHERLYANMHLQRQDICDRIGISRHALNDLFAQHAEGLSFPQYINSIRLQEALHMLREEPDMTIAAIATAVGFTPANLREQFKRQYGVTPAEYRQNM